MLVETGLNVDTAYIEWSCRTSLLPSSSVYQAVGCLGFLLPDLFHSTIEDSSINEVYVLQTHVRQDSTREERQSVPHVYTVYIECICVCVYSKIAMAI